MRKLLLMAVVVCACAPPVDTLVGSYHYSLSGTDTETAPTKSMSSPTGTGTLAVTHGLMDKTYDVTLADSMTNACLLAGTSDATDLLTIDVASGQTCTFSFATGSVTATLTTASAKLTDDTMSLTMAYSFAGTTLGINFAGTGTRTYAGPRF